MKKSKNGGGMVNMIQIFNHVIKYEKNIFNNNNIIISCVCGFLWK